ncbi:MAG: metallophosphoesterase [Candidatus Woesearchaeota archaeon]
MTKILTSSDHHGNWESLEHWFKYASKHNLPFIIPGDVVGDYNFEELAIKKGLKLPNIQIENENTKKLKKLFNQILEYHAKKLANLIEKYKVKTYFLLGNHEPIYFPELVNKNLKQKELFIDLLKEKGLTKINGFKICAISNTYQLMYFLSYIYTEKELEEMFPHQLMQRPTIINFNKEKLKEYKEPYEDPDWIRINQDEIDDLDIFITHGQIGRGAWRKEKYATELPTLLSAAKLSAKAKITIDAHLHTTHTMRNCLEKPTIRAVGNKAFLIEKDKENQLSIEELECDAPYKAKEAGPTLKDLEEIKSPVDKFLGI